jgi:hypothetical protein
MPKRIDIDSILIIGAGLNAESINKVMHGQPPIVDAI